MIEKIVNQTLEELKKANKEAYPLYYRNVFNGIAKENNLELDPRLTLENMTINEELLNKSKETTEYISKQNEDIKTHSKSFVEKVEVFDTNEDIIQAIREFEDKLIDKLNQSQKKINDLNQELEKAYKELLIDPLTKANNRKALEIALDKILEAGKDKDLNMFLMAVDLDYFKRINDTYGHLVGDFVLVKFVKLIKSMIREEDRIYRFGGDEFIIIFNRATREVIEKIAKKIVSKISSTKLKYKEEIITITTSIGITCHKKGDTIETILKRADDALYESKIHRNKATIKC